MPSWPTSQTDAGDRFVMTAPAEVKKRLQGETAELESDVSNLNKKLNYLETTFKNSRANLDRVLQSGGSG